MLYQTTNPHGGDIYTEPIRLDFSASVNPLGTPPAVLEAMQEALTRSALYPDPFCREAVSAISRHEGTAKENILMGNGAAELIYSFCWVSDIRKALIPVPAFSEYETALSGTGCRIIEHKLRCEDDFLLQDDFAEAILSSKPNAVFLCDPNNPTGRIIPLHLIRKILTMCEIVKARLFLDACFLSLTDPKPDLNGLIADHPSLIVLKALTKSHALAGIRVGYCLCSDQYLLQRMSRTVQPWNVSVIAQAAAAAAMNESLYLQRSIELIKTEREFLTKALTGTGFQVCPSEANFILFRAPAGLNDDLRRRGIAVRDCGNFRGLGPGWYRIAVRTHEENEILIRTIQIILQEKA